jgi:hypothetical protein
VNARLWLWLDNAAHLLHPTYSRWHLIPIRALDWVCDHYDHAIDQEAS